MGKWRDFIKGRASSLFSSEGSFAYAEDGYDAPQAETAAKPRRAAPSAPPTGNAQIIALDHIAQEDVTRIADYIGGNRLVVMDLADTPEEERHRILDFLSGYMYSEQGKIARINSHAYIAVPSYVDLYGAAEEDDSLYTQLTAAFGGADRAETSTKSKSVEGKESPSSTKR